MNHLRHIKSEEILRSCSCPISSPLGLQNNCDYFVSKTDDEYSDPSIIESSDDEDEVFIEDFEFSEDFIIPANYELRTIEVNKDIASIMQKEEMSMQITHGCIEDKQGMRIRELRYLMGDWLFQLSFAYPTNTETLFQCFSLMDRFLSKKSTITPRLQLIGCCCMWICSKVEFHTSASLEPLFKCCHGKFTREDFLLAEHEILKAVDYCIQSSTPYYFLRQFYEKLTKNDTFFAIAAYYCEVSLLNVTLSSYRQSLIAYCSLRIASILVSDIDISPLNQYTKDFSNHDQNDCILQLWKSGRSLIDKEKLGVCKKLSLRCKNDTAISLIVKGYDLVQPFTKLYNK